MILHDMYKGEQKNSHWNQTNLFILDRRMHKNCSHFLIYMIPKNSRYECVHVHCAMCTLEFIFFNAITSYLCSILYIWICNFIAIPKKDRCYCLFVIFNKNKKKILFSLASELWFDDGNLLQWKIVCSVVVLMPISELASIFYFFLLPLVPFSIFFFSKSSSLYLFQHSLMVCDMFNISCYASIEHILFLVEFYFLSTSSNNKYDEKYAQE